MHNLIDSLNPNLHTIENYKGKVRKREFFAMSPQDAYKLLTAIAKISGTETNLKLWNMTKAEKEDLQEANSIQKRRPPFRFSMLNIKPGTELTFINDDTIKAIVVDDKNVEYQNEIMSLSALAQLLFNDGNSRQRQGPAYFTYNGETLKNLREQREKA